MRLENYLKEAHGGSYGTYGTGRTKHLSREEFYKELKNYSDMANYYLKGGVLFMRGVKRSAAGEFGHVVPIESKRESAYTSNYYTLISSYDSSWNGIPPRDRSIVGSTDYDKASGYAGGGQSDGFYVVLPKNGSVIGEADAVDFWMTFKHIFGDSYYPLGRLNDDITRIFKVIGQGVSDDSLSSLKKACKAVDKALKDSITVKDRWGETDETFDWSYIIGETEYGDKMQDNYEGDFYKMLLSIFDPKAANIKVVKAGQSLREGVEVWTTGESLLIRYSIFEREKDSIREALK